jgi:hypothetical protein
MSNLVVIGSTENILAGMFRQVDGHVIAWHRWRFLYERGIVDRSGVILLGRRKGMRIRS